MRGALRLIPLVFVVVACASGGASYPEGASRDVIVKSEIDAVNVSNAYEAIQRLRPHMLRFRGPRSLSGGGGIGSRDIVVYVDGVQYGGSETLRNILTTQVERIQYLDPSQATAEFGTGHLHGAILITTPSGVERVG